MAEPAPAASGGIFISYRREDTGYSAGWLFDRLTSRLGQDRVFKDVDSIELGENFVEVIMAAVGSCDVLLALIGDRWLTVADADGNRRLDDPNDFVRLEIEAALSRDVRVIPILVDGAALPRPDQLPPGMAKLVRFHGLELSPSRFAADTNRLIEVLERAQVVSATDPPTPASVPAATPPPPPAVGPPPTPTQPPPQQPPPPSPQPPRVGALASTRAMAILGGALALLLLLLVVVVVSNGGSDSSGSGTGTSVTSSPVTSVGADSTAASASTAAGTIFADDFSSDAGGWQADGDGSGGRVEGRYEVRIDPTAAGAGVVSGPVNATSVYPVAPPNVRIEATAHRISSTGPDAAMALVCRVTDGGLYAFLIGGEEVVIGKVVGGAYEELAQKSLRFDPNAVVRLQAVCRSEGAGQHLSFSVNGNPVVSADDRTNPLPNGTLGVGAFVGEGPHSVVAQFDDFSVTAV